uniref:Uncharacterized protein n=1 Tax=Meloidogyne incognita TaxID=6306 RepID=A0A914NYK8_MELIC
MWPCQLSCNYIICQMNTKNSCRISTGCYMKKPANQSILVRHCTFCQVFIQY